MDFLPEDLLEQLRMHLDRSQEAGIHGLEPPTPPVGLVPSPMGDRRIPKASPSSRTKWL